MASLLLPSQLRGRPGALGATGSFSVTCEKPGSRLSELFATREKAEPVYAVCVADPAYTRAELRTPDGALVMGMSRPGPKPTLSQVLTGGLPKPAPADARPAARNAIMLGAGALALLYLVTR